MNETQPDSRQTEPSVLQTSDEKVWQSPGYHIVETALEVTAYALGDRRTTARRTP
ncbi:pyrroloquinoline quinone precursor peptide PqqA [Streptomyces sp. NPDC046915]|uniref:pyrroloquinoline quinone precursor peptide PqqA n=1 Tax=Streptomyces sp. NPDC046915 TaxID=3155257 RepID=UPI0033D111ED